MNERVVQFGEWKTLAGVVSRGDDLHGASRPAVIFLNAGLLHRIGPNRLSVRMARELAGAQVSSLRFDHAGIGDSPPRRDRKTALESTVIETQEAMDFMTAECGATRFVLVGLCSGADVALRTAAIDPRVTGLVLLDSYAYKTTRNKMIYLLSQLAHPPALSTCVERIRGWLRDLLPGKRERASEPGFGFFVAPPREEAESMLANLQRRDVRMLFVYTLSRYYNYAGQFQAMFPSLRFGRELEVDYLPHADHTYTLRQHQQQLSDRIGRWILHSDWIDESEEDGADEERFESVI